MIKLLIICILITSILSCDFNRSKSNTNGINQEDSIKLNNCTYETDQNNDSVMKNQLIEKVLLEQVKQGYSAYNRNFTKEEILALIAVEKELLRKKGIIEVSRNDFIKRISEIFNLEIINENDIFIYNNETGKLEILNEKYIIEEGEENKYFCISIKDQLITDFIRLPLLINYRSNYPAIASIEDQDTWKDPDGLWFRWIDIDGINKLRERKINTVINRNRYLVNNDKASLTWLINNDKDYLFNLLTTFGYDKEYNINILALDMAYERYKKKSHITLRQ